jgi:type IV secretory pathway VirD2 relaxase
MPPRDDEPRGSSPIEPRPADEDRGRFRPKIGRRARDRLASGTPGIARLVLGGHGKRGRSRAPVRSLAAGTGPGRHARRVVIQAHVHRLRGGGAKAAADHLAYIERDGAEKDGSPAVLYGPDGRVPRERFEEPRLNEQHQFRFVVSPEDGHELDLHDYVRRLMHRVERELGRSLEWAAANHYDTEHPHAHVVVRGVDLDGRRVLLSRQYISHGMRWSAQELATELLGPRLESEIQRTREREVTQERHTSLDRELARCSTGSQVDALSVRRQARDEREAQHLLDRLEHLERLGVAERVSPSSWSFTPDWQRQLRALGERGDIIKQIHRAMRGGDEARFHAVRPGQGLPDGRGGVDEQVQVGRVASKGLEDESKGVWYAVLETPTGAAYHVRLTARQAEATRSGDLVMFGTAREAAVRPADRHIAEVAGRHGGVYARADDVDRADAARAAAGRLRELARQGLVTAQDPGLWRVPPDLLEQLEQRHRDAPRYRLSMQPAPMTLDAQVRHPGPVWLDTVDAPALAGSGFGAEVRQALERRRDALRELGIAPDDPHRDATLQELRRRAVGREIEKRVGETFLETVPEGFRGRVHALPESTPYLAVTDGHRFVLVAATPEGRARAGQSVEVGRDAHGRMVLREDPALAAERQERARQIAGETFARETRQTFLPTVPNGFRGWVQPGPEGAPHLAISDGRRFILVPATPETRALSGKTVEVSRDAQVRLVGLHRRDRDLDRGR